MLEILVQNATEEFGFFPRDVYCGVFNLPYSRAEHDPALGGFSCARLKSLLEEFRNFNIDSDLVIAVHPIHVGSNIDLWRVDFKSNQIAEKVVELLRLEEDTHLQETYNILKANSKTSSMAGWVLNWNDLQWSARNRSRLPMVTDDRIN